MWFVVAVAVVAVDTDNIADSTVGDIADMSRDYNIVVAVVDSIAGIVVEPVDRSGSCTLLVVHYSTVVDYRGFA